MVRNYILAGGFAVICGAAVASAQSTTPQQPPQAQPPAAMDHSASTTIEGCVYREQDIPGRAPNVAERAGIMEDYILVASTGSSATGAVGTSGTATAAAAKMFKLEHVDDEKLKAMVGKRVRVVGKADVKHSDMTKAPAATPQADRSMGPDKINLPEFEVSSISETTGTCPAKADMKK